MRRFCFSWSDRTSIRASLLLAALLVSSPAAFSRSTSEKLAQASSYYDQAVTARLALDEIPPEKRSRQDYSKVIQTYRLVYATAPTSPQNAKSLLAIGELYRQMGRDLKNEKAFTSAIEVYDFLLQEYPFSQVRSAAMLAAAQIYQSDLKQPEEARKRFEQLLSKHPRSLQVEAARQGIAQIDAEMASRQAPEPPKVPASNEPDAPKQVSVASGDRVPVTDVRRWVTPTSTRVVIDVAGEVKYDVGKLDNPPRIFMDLYGTKIDRAVTRKIFSTDSGSVKRLRAAQYQLNVTRVVLEVDARTDYSVFDLPNPYRLVIEIRSPAQGKQALGKQAIAGNDRPQSQATYSSSGNPAVEETPVVQTAIQAAKQINPLPVSVDKSGATQVTQKPAPTRPNRDGIRSVAAAVVKPIPSPIAETLSPAEPPSRNVTPSLPELASVAKPGATSIPQKSSAQPNRNSIRSEPATVNKPVANLGPGRIQPAQPNRDGSRSLTRALGLKIGRIIIDPGHGGHDTGTIGPSGLNEKELVLDVSLRLGKLISQRLGSEVVYTREDDTFVPLETRTAIANEKQADLFLSIHANSSSSPRARGIETYYLSFVTDPEALEVAARENAVSQESVHQLQDLVKKIALNEKVDESREFAADLQSALLTRLNKDNRQRKDRGVKKAPFMVLVGAKMPSVLAEIAFLSNPQEEKLLRTKAQRQKIAEALYAGIARYVDTLSGVKVARSADIGDAAAK